MKALYIWIIILTAIGVALSIYLIPSKEDIALLESKSNEYVEAEQYFVEQYKKGDRSPDVIGSLERLNIQQGKIKEAISLLEEYRQTHPNDTKALQMLADLYRSDQQYEKYFQTLIELRKHKIEKKMDQDILQILAEKYSTEDDLEHLFSILKELFETKTGDASNFMELALIYAEQKNYRKAYEVLEERRKKFPKDVSIGDVFFEIWTLIEVGKEEGRKKEAEVTAVFLLKEYLIEKNDPKLTYYALEFFKERYPYMTPYLISQLNPLIEKNRFLEITSDEILWDKSLDKGRLFAKLLDLYGQNKIDPPLQNLLFKIFLEKHYDILLSDLMRRTDVRNLEESQILALAYLSIVWDKPFLAAEMQRLLGKEYLDNHPIVSIALTVALQEQDMRRKLEFFWKTTYLTQSEKYYLFKLTSAAKFNDLAFEIGSSLPPYYGMTEQDLAEIAMIYIQMKKPKELYEMIVRSLPEIGNKNAGAALAILNAALQRSKKTASWLYNQEHVSEEILLNIYTVASDNKEYPLALYAAKRLEKEYPSSLSHAYYASALIHVGKVEYGLYLLEKLYLTHPYDREIESLYFYALVEETKRNPKYSDKLRILIHLKETQECLSPELLRDIAFIYLNILHDIPSAVKYFEILARNAPNHNNDVETLLYLWGPCYSPIKCRWVIERTIGARGEEFGLWLRDLSYLGCYCDVIAIFEERLAIIGPCEMPKIAYFAYMESLVFLEKFCELQSAIDLAFVHMHTLKDFEALSIFAEQAEYLSANRRIWERIVCDYPNEIRFWQKLAKVSLDQRDYCGTACAFLKFFELYCQRGTPYNPYLYESFFDYADSLYYRYHYREAKMFYLLTLYQIVAASETTPRMVELESLSLYRLAEVDANLELLNFYRNDRQRVALFVMQQLYEMTSRDPNAAGTFANMMMDAGRFNEAREFINGGINY